MAKLHELRRERAALAAKKSELLTNLREAKSAWRVLLEEAPPGDTLPPEAKPLESRVTDCESALDEHQKSIDDHDSRINDLEHAQDDEGQRSFEVSQLERRSLREDHANGYGYNEPGTAREGKGFKAARFAIGILVARGSGMASAADYVERRFYDKDVAKALNTSGVATGGALIPQAFSNEIIELLRAATVIRACEPMIVDMPPAIRASWMT
jgi:HK97 family phage major capsid protein